MHNKLTINHVSNKHIKDVAILLLIPR